MSGTAHSHSAGVPGLVSVVIPCYNYGRFLAEAVLSVIEQTHPSWELVIVDDGSSDDTIAIAHRLQQIYAQQKINVIHRERGGMNAARNTGINHTCGAYVLALDADDLIAPTFLQETVAILDHDPGIGFAYTDVLLFGNVQDTWRLGQFTLEDLKRANRVVCHSLFRRSAWLSCGGYNEAMRLGYEDWDFWLRLAERGWRWQGLPVPLAYYRRHGTSMIDRARSQSILLRAQIILNHPALYGPRLVRLAHEICAVGEDVSALSVGPVLQQPSAGTCANVKALIKKALVHAMDPLPLYHQMLLRKWFYMLQQRMNTI